MNSYVHVTDTLIVWFVSARGCRRLPDGGNFRAAPGPAAGQAEGDERERGDQAGAGGDVVADRVDGAGQPGRGGAGHTGQIDRRGQDQAAEDQPVQLGGGIDRQQADRHHVVPGALVGPHQQPGQAEGQGRAERGQVRGAVRKAQEGQGGDGQEGDGG